MERDEDGLSDGRAWMDDEELSEVLVGPDRRVCYEF